MPAKADTVELVFVLDTTGSMGGLIQGAKTKIWSIINEVAQNGQRDVRVGLVAYRDRKDSYVTQVTPISDQLDDVYQTLMAYQARGGGDFPEDVRMAMRDALEKMNWSNKTSKIIFLVGDAPPHDDYPDVPATEKTAERAKARGILVNTIQAGRHAQTTAAWQKIAQYGGGEYFSIAQDGGVSSTYMAYGSLSAISSAKQANVAKEEAIAAAPVAAQADRAKNKAFNSRAFDSRDLVQEIENKRITLSQVKDSELPTEMQKMSAAERQRYIDQQITNRKEIRLQIMDLSQKREAFLKENQKEGDGFDSVVSKALKKQIK
jgi:uncharacterized protein YegL